MDTICLPARLDCLGRFREFVFEKLAARGVPPDAFSKVELILEELLTNVFYYAYTGAEGQAELACTVREGMLHLSITDWGAAFNPLDSPPPNLSADIDERSVGGLGIYFVRETVDEITYERRDGRNIVSLAMKVSP